jgi:glycerate dehydrogenase
LDGFTENPGDLSWAEFRGFGRAVIYDRQFVDDEDEIIDRIGDAGSFTPIKRPSQKKSSMLVPA